MNISDEAVEAAARAHQGKPVGRMAWDELAPMVRRIRLKKMRAALEAAAPHLMAAYEETLEVQRETISLLIGAVQKK